MVTNPRLPCFHHTPRSPKRRAIKEAKPSRPGSVTWENSPGLSAKTVQRLEQRLEEFRLVEITRPKLPGYHTYTLLSLRLDDTTSGQGDLTLGHYTFLNIRP